MTGGAHIWCSVATTVDLRLAVCIFVQQQNDTVLVMTASKKNRLTTPRIMKLLRPKVQTTAVLMLCWFSDNE